MQQSMEGFRAGDFLAPDRIHPNDRGHQYIAQLVARFLQRAMAEEQQRRALGALQQPQEQAQQPREQPQQSQEQPQKQAQEQAQQDKPKQDKPKQQKPKQDKQGKSGWLAAIAPLKEKLAAAKAAEAAEAAAAAAVQLLTPFATADPSALPPPMLEGAEPLVAETCLRGLAMRTAIERSATSNGWWFDDAGAGEVRAATELVGAQLGFKIDTGEGMRRVAQAQPPR